MLPLATTKIAKKIAAKPTPAQLLGNFAGHELIFLRLKNLQYPTDVVFL